MMVFHEGEKGGCPVYAPLVLVVLLSACTSIPKTMIHNAVPNGNPKGYVEFYCGGCMAGWVVFEVKDGQEVYVASQNMGRSIAGLLSLPSRMRKLGVAHDPGEVEFLIRLIPPSLSGSISARIRTRVLHDHLLPVRILFHKHSDKTFDWGVSAGELLPLTNDRAGTLVLWDALNSPDWGTRWYAAEVVGRIGGGVNDALETRLNELAGDEAYQRCLTKEQVFECSLVQQQAADILAKIRE